MFSVGIAVYARCRCRGGGPHSIMSLRRVACLVVFWIATVSSADAEIEIDCRGSGQPVYLIGGGPAFSTWNLAPVQQKLAVEYRVCRWDMRGVGENASLTVRQDAPLLKQWLDDMASVLPEQPVVLWGHSWGALQSLLFARDYPQRVRAVVLNNPVDPQLKSLVNIELKRYVHPYVEAQLTLDEMDTPAEQRHRFRSKIASYFMDAELGWAYSAAFNPEDTSNDLNVRIWEEYRDMPLTQEDMDVMAVKIGKVIFCRHDVLMPESRDEYARIVPPEKRHVIEQCAHFPWIESPDEFYDILLDTMHEVTLQP